MSQIFVVGGHGYVGTRIAAEVQDTGERVHAVSRNGGTRFGLPSTSWPDFLTALPEHEDARVIWLLDGANDDEPERLSELLAAVRPDAAVVAVSTCTVYGDRGDEMCTEKFERHLLTSHAKIKAALKTRWPQLPSPAARCDSAPSTESTTAVSDLTASKSGWAKVDGME